MRNLFILNGSTPMLVADSLMRTALAYDENIVIIENIDPDFSRIESSIADKKNAAPGSNMRRAEDLLALTLPARLRLKCQYATEYPNFRRRPRAFLREARRTVEAAQRIESQLGASFDRMFYSGNARLQYALADWAPSRIRLEHGLGDYMFANEKPAFGNRVRRRVVSAIAGFREFDPDEILLADAGKCRSVSSDLPGVRRIAAPDVSAQLERLMMILADEEPQLVIVLERLRTKASCFDEVIIYMPLDRFPMDSYGRLLDEQLKRLDAGRTLFLIKPHPTDPVDYLDLFVTRNLSAMRIDHPVGRYLPVEFIAALLPSAHLMGVGSSALFYGKWWMDRTIVYASVGMEERIGIYRAINAAFAADIALFGSG